MLWDSHSTKPSSSMVGTSPVGFILRYSGVLLTPNCMPASMRWYFSPSSSAAHSAFFTFTELVLPQIFSMVSPKSGIDHVSFLYRLAKNVVCPCFSVSKSLRPGRLCGDRSRQNNRRRASRPIARTGIGGGHGQRKGFLGRGARGLQAPPPRTPFGAG